MFVFEVSKLLGSAVFVSSSEFVIESWIILLATYRKDHHWEMYVKKPEFQLKFDLKQNPEMRWLLGYDAKIGRTLTPAAVA